MDHIAECPEVSPKHCMENDIPALWHRQGAQLYQMVPTLNVGFGAGWQMALTLPLDLKISSIDYVTLSGEGYDPPYAGMHHRNETLFGPADGTLMVNYYFGLGSASSMGISVGSTLPIGRIEADPFMLGNMSIEHQHFQRGTGTFVPTARLEFFSSQLRWRQMAWGAMKWPLYENRMGYTPSRLLSFGLGGGYRLTTKTQVLLVGEGEHSSPDIWAGSNGSAPGRDAVVLGLTGIHSLNDNVTLQFQVKKTVWRQTLPEDTEHQLIQNLLIVAGLSWTPGSQAAESLEDPTTESSE